MNRQTLASALLVFLLSVGNIATLMAQDIRIGYVNSARVLKEAPQAEAARKKLESEFAPRDKEIVTMQKTLKKLDDDLARNASVMSESVIKQKEREIISMQRDIKRAQEEFNEDLNIRRNDEINVLQQKVNDAIISVAKEESFDVVLGESVMFASKRVDVTDKVIERLRQEFEQVKKLSSGVGKK